MTFIPPHMATQTAFVLGRKPFAFFRYWKSKSFSADWVAEKVVRALLKKQEFVCSLSTRLKLAINQLLPSCIKLRQKN